MVARLRGQFRRWVPTSVKMVGLGMVLGACAANPAETVEAPQAAKSSKPMTEVVGSPAKAVTAKSQMVSAANPLAAQAGLDILRAGGSAMDAAIATQLVLGLVEPQSSGLGGGAFILHYAGKDGAIKAYDGRETAPAAATADMFLKADGEPMSFRDAVPGGLSVGVPGVVRVLERAHKAHGRLPWAQLFRPAIVLAEEGFALSPRLYTQLRRALTRRLGEFPATAAYFLDAEGGAKPVGTILKNPAYAETLRQIAARGSIAFYEGPIAESIVAAVRGTHRNPGRMTLADIKSYQAKVREPVCSLYRIWVVCGMSPPTSGGVTVLQILGLLQNFDLSAMKPGSVDAVHVISEASRLAFADRNRYLADPDFVSIPVKRLIDPGYLSRRARAISMTQSMGTAKSGNIPIQGAGRFAPDLSDGGTSTSHLSVVDKDGNAITMTTTIENVFGSLVMASGFMLNNQLTDFSFRERRNERLVANRVEPGKRPRSSMSPTFVLDAGGKLVLAIGSPGGSRIIGYVTKAIIGVLDWKLDVQEAISLPNFTNRNGGTDLEANTGLTRLWSALESRGHGVGVVQMTSGLHGIRVYKDRLEGGADPRREGIAVGD
ncbi:MAG: gamma-glutamyltransferase [Proteobacteria bacterium]|nr:gamma-glutamyltransferase [Pseudomonadota bacterium]